MSARFCNNCGRINPAENHPLGGCTCSRPDFTVRPSAGERIRSLEDQLPTLRALIADRFHEAKQYDRNAEAAFLAYLLDALREDARRLEKLGGDR